MVIDDDTAKNNNLAVGSKITLENRAGKQSSFDVAGIVKNSQLVNGVLASPAGFAPLSDTKGVAFMFVMTDPNADLERGAGSR